MAKKIFLSLGVVFLSWWYAFANDSQHVSNLAAVPPTSSQTAVTSSTSPVASNIPSSGSGQQVAALNRDPDDDEDSWFDYDSDGDGPSSGGSAPAQSTQTGSTASSGSASGSSSSSSQSSTPTPASQPASTGKYKNGTYTGSTENAIYGYVQVQATVSGGKITDVQFLQYPSDRSTSRMINSQAMPALTQEAISVQSAQVNAVSGATATSEAFIRSLTSALSQA